MRKTEGLYIQFDEPATKITFEATMEELQRLVQGHFQFVNLPINPKTGKALTLICNEEGKYTFGNQPTAMLVEPGNLRPLDMICGPFLVCGEIVVGEYDDDYTSLVEADYDWIRHMFIGVDWREVVHDRN